MHCPVKMRTKIVKITHSVVSDALYGDDVVMLAPTVSLGGKNLNFFRCFFSGVGWRHKTWTDRLFR